LQLGAQTFFRLWGVKAPLASLSVLLLSVAANAVTPCTAFVDVTVVATDRPVLDPHRTVTVRGDRIQSISSGPPPAECRKIESDGRYLIPGLVDSHVHMWGYSRGGEGNSAAEHAVLSMLLANGVTTAVIMEGAPASLRLRQQVNSRTVLGPTLYTTGPLIQASGTGAPAGRQTFDTPDEVRREVESERRLGYDFVKVHGGMPRETYAALLETAKRVGLPVIGHVPDNLGIDAALDGGQVMIAHVESYLQTYFEFNRELPTDPAEIDRMVQEIANRTAQARVYVQPTLSVFRQIIDQIADPDQVLQRPEVGLLPKAMIRDWLPDRNPYLHHWTLSNIAHFRAEYAVMQRLVRGLRDAGVPLLMGTDDMAPVQLPGFAVPDELRQLQQAGLTPFQVLQTATSNAARFLRHEADSGAVKPGYAADLVLLEANPLEAADNLTRQAGVMLHGRWFPEGELQDSLWARYQTPGAR
jgi:imidazolonepropionase-like amidohydrolase